MTGARPCITPSVAVKRAAQLATIRAHLALRQTLLKPYSESTYSYFSITRLARSRSQLRVGEEDRDENTDMTVQSKA